MKKKNSLVYLGTISLLVGAGCGEKPIENGHEQDLCGNNVVDPGEECDGDDLQGMSCDDFGYYFGELACSDECTFDTSSCFGFCGDGVAHLDQGEECDGEDLAGKTCRDLGFHGVEADGGVLSCSADCTFDVSLCVGEYCGDGIAQEEHGEECDGDDLLGKTCQDVGFYEGELACSEQCTFDTSACVGYCGDGVVWSEHGELCDDGVNDGIYGCLTDCSGYAPKYCGDGVVHAEHGEQCDGEILDGVTCEDLGFAGGTLSCGDDCRYDTSGCLGEVDPLYALFGDTLVNAQEEPVATSSLAGRIIGIYFTTGWCGPCLGFTPILVDVYNELQEQERPFAVVSVSWDHSEEDMFDYMRNYNMPWKAVPYHSERRQALNELYGVSGVPTLIIIDSMGETISTNGRNEVEEHGADAYDLWSE